jgi:tRNA(adenine34) deaminase
VNYELYMGEALAEARSAVAQGERPHAAVAVVDEAMVARAHDRVHESDDPTAHAVVLALREAARRVGKERLREATIFCTMEPCPMCVGAMLASDVEELVFAVPNREAGAAGTLVQLADHPAMRRRIRVVSGIRAGEVEELYAAFAR